MRSRTIIRTFFCVLFVGYSCPLSGQSLVTGTPSDLSLAASADGSPAPSSITLPEVIVTAPLDRLVPNSSLTASILTRSQMKPYQPRTLGAALAPVAGVDVASYGGLGSAELVSLRGSNSDRVLVLKDGQRLNTAQGGGVDLSSLPVDQIERVEVIRGLAPSRYGVEGLGGIVNIVTSRGHEEASSSSVRLEGASGSFGTYKTNGRFDHRFGSDGKYELSLSGGYAESRGGYDFLDPVRDKWVVRNNTDLKRATASADLVFPASSAWSNRLSWNWLGQDAGAPGSSEFPTPHARIHTEKNIFQFQSDAVGIFPADADSQASLSLQAQFQDLHYTNQGPFNTFEDDNHRNQSYEARLDAQTALNGDWRLDPSLGFRADHLDSTSDGVRDNRVAYAALEASWFAERFEGVKLVQDHAARWVVTAGARAEASSLFPSFFVPRLGVLWTWDREEGLALKANAGQLVRYPTFDDLFFPATGLAKGNPDLLPEHSTTGDLGLIWSPGALSFGSTFFLQSVTNLIQWTPDFAGVWRPNNISQALIYGLELEGRLSPVALNDFLQWGADASYTQMDTRDESGRPNVQGNQLVYRPNGKGALGTTVILWENLQVSYRGRFVGYRYIVASNTAYVPGFFTQQLGARMTVMKGVDVSATVYNLAGANYFEVDDYPMPGREWEVKTSLAF